jgi:hypothetical protein
MTPERIAELRALCKAATPEPWKNAFRSSQVPDGEGRPPFDIFVGDEDDVAFIAAARTALPEALDRIEFLQTLLAEGKGYVLDAIKAKAAIERVRNLALSYGPESWAFHVALLFLDTLEGGSRWQMAGYATMRERAEDEGLGGAPYPDDIGEMIPFEQESEAHRTAREQIIKELGPMFTRTHGA